jgi:hypothetical protein
MFYISINLFKTDFYMIYIKMTKFVSKTSLFVTHFLTFFVEATENICIFRKLCITKVEYGDTHTYIFFLNFITF